MNSSQTGYLHFYWRLHAVPCTSGHGGGGGGGCARCARHGAAFFFACGEGGGEGERAGRGARGKEGKRGAGEGVKVALWRGSGGVFKVAGGVFGKLASRCRTREKMEKRWGKSVGLRG